MIGRTVIPDSVCPHDAKTYFEKRIDKISNETTYIPMSSFCASEMNWIETQEATKVFVKDQSCPDIMVYFNGQFHHLKRNNSLEKSGMN